MHVDEHMAKGIRQCVPRSLVVLHSNSFFFLTWNCLQIIPSR